MSKLTKLTKQQWQEIEEKLKSLYSPVRLNCDGYHVTLMLDRISKFKNAITVYVDGRFKGLWMTIEKDTEEGRRFFPVRSKARCAAKEKDRLIRLFGKRKARKIFKIDNSHEWRVPYWKSFGPLKRHFITNNTSIELLEEND